VPPRAAAAWPPLRSLGAGCAGSYAGARHGVARGSTYAASGGGGLAVAALARRGLRRLLSWRASRCGARWQVCRLGRRRLGRRCARSAQAAPAFTLARVTVWREAARVPPQAVTAWPLLRSLHAGCAGFYAGARHGVARGGTLDAGCAGSYAGARHGVAQGGKYAASGGGGLAVPALADCGPRWLLRWRASRCGARRHVCRLRRRRGLAAAALAERGLRRLLRWRASRCGARWHVCRLRRRRLGRRCARSARAAPASTLARARGCARWHVCRLGRRRLGRRCNRSARAAPASTLARVTVRREAARVPPQAVTAWLSLRSLGAGCAGSYAGARHGVARGGTCAASGGDGLAVPALARRGLRRLLRWRASRCGARRHVCRLRR